jgi:hypothetical protein
MSETRKIAAILVADVVGYSRGGRGPQALSVRENAIRLGR